MIEQVVAGFGFFEVELEPYQTNKGVFHVYAHFGQILNGFIISSSLKLLTFTNRDEHKSLTKRPYIFLFHPK